MAQHDYGNPVSPFTGTQLNNRLRSCFDALHSLHRGTSRPNYAVAGMLWLREISSTEWRLHLYDGDTDILLGTINPTANTFTPAGVTGFAPLTGATFTGPVVVPNATADGHALNRITGDERYARLTGATFTGDVSVTKANPALFLHKTAAQQLARVISTVNGVFRWSVEVANAQSETGGNAGSNFVIVRCADNGAPIGIPLFINRATGEVTLEAPLTLPASNPTDANHAARKAYVDAGDRWVTLVDEAVTNSTTIDVTGFSLQNYRMLKVLLLGAQLSSASASGSTTARVYRGGSLVTTGYAWQRLTTSSWTATAGNVDNHANVTLTFSGMSTDPVFMDIDVTQSASSSNAVFYANVFYNTTSAPVINCVVGRATGGSGWTDGVRITAPDTFQNNVGRIVVLGLKP
jgi:hypothetical protein